MWPDTSGHRQTPSRSSNRAEAPRRPSSSQFATVDATEGVNQGLVRRVSRQSSSQQTRTECPGPNRAVNIRHAHEQRSSHETRDVDAAESRGDVSLKCKYSMQCHHHRVRRDRRRMVDVIKRSTVSTALLKGSHPLHMRPINLVVYQGSHAKQADLILGGASRLDAFSGYPCRT